MCLLVCWMRTLRPCKRGQTTSGQRSRCGLSRICFSGLVPVGSAPLVRFRRRVPVRVLFGQELQNAAAARGQFNDITSRNFGMHPQAASQNNDAALRAGALGLQGRDLLASNYNSNQGNLFNQGLQQAGFAQSLKDDWFKQAQSALGTANAMRSEDRSWDLQDYQNKLAENQAAYGRTNDQYNHLTGASQQAFANQLSTRAANQGQYGALNNTNMQLAGWNNEANVANTQMQNSYNAANAQREAAANAAMWQGGANAIGAGLNAWGQYSGQEADD